MGDIEDAARIKRCFRERAEVSALSLFGSLARDPGKGNRVNAESDIDKIDSYLGVIRQRLG